MTGRMGLSATRRGILLAGGTLLLAGCAGSAGLPLAASSAEGAALTARLADVGAVREIKRLQHIWGHLADTGQWADMAALFTDDGVWTDGTNSFSGRASVEGHLRSTMGSGVDGLDAGKLNIRLFLSPVITLSPDGNSARGRWHEVAMTGENGKSADWAGGINIIDYSRTPRGWKIRKMRYHAQYAGPYSKGWNHVQTIVPMVPYHYTPDQAGTPWPAAREAAIAKPDEVLNAEAEQLLIASTVQNLQAAYGFYLDRKLYADMVDLFTTDAVVDVAGVGQYRGKTSIRRGLNRFGNEGLGHGELNDRPQLMPVVTVSADGASASLRNVEIGMTGQHAGETFWSAAIQEFSFTKGADGVWRISGLNRFPRMRATYVKGWQEPLEAALPMQDGAAPDGASQLARADYPANPPVKAKFAGSLAPAPSFTVGGDISAKIAKASAFDGAENVSTAYGYYIDEFDWDGTAGLFSRDGWKELSYIGTYIGRERVLGSLYNRYGKIGRSPAFMAIHQKTQPFVSVSDDGNRANIRLRLFQFNSSDKGVGSWISGIYENQAILEDGIWRIHGMDLDYVWLADYTGGWAGIEPGSSARYAPAPEDVAKYPPDAPLRGVTFAPFPEVAPMGFHFSNPVSDRSPLIQLNWTDGRRLNISE